MSRPILPEQIQGHLVRALLALDPHAEVRVSRTSLGWISLRISTSCFMSRQLVERERQVDKILAALDLNLGSYPFADYELLTPEEAESQVSQLIQMPLWSEILMAPEPNRRVSLDEDVSKRPFIVTFYSFKGGVGRSTALGIVAGVLTARGRRVVMVDFDLEAPGLSFMFAPNAATGEDQYGILDYLHQRYLTPDKNIPSIDQCIRQIDT